MPMNPEIKAQWITDLRSGEFEQGTGQLHYESTDGKQRYCCLGVLCRLAQKAGIVTPQIEGDPGDGYMVRYDGATSMLPNSVVDWAGLEDHGSGDVLITMSQRLGKVLATTLNDSHAWKYTFAQIADALEADETV